ncbi:MAG: hypothetical protein FJ034_07380 [Chloroflexi bacterium]|nr:hypothetical protein [Chloroflexota bacterium]
MLRTFAQVEQRRFMLPVLVFLVTMFFGFVVQAAGSYFLRVTGDPIANGYRTTLSYTSALIGDAFLLPLVNVFMTTQLLDWRRRPRRHEVAAAVLGGLALTVFVHLYQAANALLNWTMPVPYRWEPLGYEHAAFMFAELSFVLFFWGEAALVMRERPRAIFTHRVGMALLCSLVFLRLLLGDYGYF